MKITGPWLAGSCNGYGEQFIGKFATVIDVINSRKHMSIVIQMDDDPPDMRFNWDRESLRALPHKTKQ